MLSNALTYFFTLILAAPLVIGYLQTLNLAFMSVLWKGIEFIVPIGIFETVITVYSVSINVLGIICPIVAAGYCLASFKMKMIRSIEEKEPITLATILNGHSQVGQANPFLLMIKYFHIKKSWLALASISIGLALGGYANSMALIVTRYNAWKTQETSQYGFPNHLPNSDYFKTFLPALFEEKLTTLISSLYGVDIPPSYVSLLGFIPSSWREDGSATIANLVGIGPIPILDLKIADWSYNILERSGTAATGEAVYGNDQYLKNVPDSSKVIFHDLDTKCLTTQSFPWTACRLPEKIPFTIVQKIPAAGSIPSLTYNTNVFKFTGGNDNAYVLKGTLGFSRKSVNLQRNPDTMLLELKATGVALFGDMRYENLYQATKVGAILNIFHQMNGSYITGSSYSWKQLISLIPTGVLIRDLANYSSVDYVNEMSRRFTVSTQYWLDKTAPQDPNMIQLVVQTGQMVEIVLAGLAFISGCVFLIFPHHLHSKVVV